MGIYFRESKKLHYSLAASLPLLIAYEILLAWTSHRDWQIRNAADVWLRKPFLLFELTPQQVSLFMILSILFMIPFAYLKYGRWQWKYFGYMLAESMVYSIVILMLLPSLLSALTPLAAGLGGGVLQNIALSLGAGLFEELFFRVLLFNVLFALLHWTFRSAGFSAIVAILAASFLFSLSHYIGELSDPFQWYSFTFRWVAGLVFTILYFLRGFAITAYTHALYDIWVLT